ncbi:helix-turn-helix domain-containing protein [Kribbella sp. NBC_00382]|uniref:helix-turn-helix domain-containing protein n=1 Tax=Kribbella sp. NBC_00382 TaxID=2975967 RepID=UPI002E24FD97
MSDFGGVLRAFRKAAGLSQERLAAVSGVSVEAVKTLETGRRRRPRSATVMLLADGLELTEPQRAELAAAGTQTRPRVTDLHQLPDDLQDFSGREQQVAELEEVFATQDLRPGVVLTSAIAGMGGIGKTALAVHVAHRLADRYPDGQLYLNLRGFGPGLPMTVEEALGRLMESLGVPAPDDPHDVDEAASRYRSAVAGLRVLVLLDNAASAAQVAPLLPGASTCAVLITSRRTLAALPGVARVGLDVLPDRDAVQMLSMVVGGDRIAADPANALSIVRLCGGLPLALRIAAARLADEPSWTVADLAQRLESSRGHLDEFSSADLDLRASIEAALAAATDRDADAVTAFKLLGLHEGDELDIRVAAALLDLPLVEAEDRLERLVDLHLLDSVVPGRYRMHDLIRSFVQETTAALTDEPAREAARLRVLRRYLAMAWRSRTLTFTEPLTEDWSKGGWTADAESLTLEELFGWLDEEIEEIIAALHRASDATPAERELVARIVIGLLPYLHARRRYSDGVALGTIAADRSAGDPFAAAIVPYELAQQCGAAGRYQAAVEHMTTSLAALKNLPYEDKYFEGQVFLGEYLAELGRYDEASAVAAAGTEGAIRHGIEIIEADGRLILGIVAGRQARTEVQDDEFRRAVELVRRFGNANAQRWILSAVGSSYRESGRFDDALAYLDEARRRAIAAGDEFAAAEADEDLGRTEFARGHLEVAERHLTAALDVLRGTWQSEARVREHLGRVMQAAGRPDEASQQWGSALELLVRHGAPQADDLRLLLAEVRSSS